MTCSSDSQPITTLPLAQHLEAFHSASLNSLGKTLRRLNLPLHLTLVGLVLAFFAPVWLFDRALYIRDTGFYFFPHKMMLGLGQWNPREYGGLPLLVDPNFNAFHPVTWLLSGWRTPGGFAAFVALHALVAGYGAYVWAREFGATRFAAKVTAVGFIGGGAFVSLIESGQVIAATFLPWFGWAGLRVYQRRSGLAALALVTALAIVSGTPEFALLGFLLAAVCSHTVDGLRGFPRLVAGITLGAALAATQIVPTWLYLAESSRSQGLPAAEVMSGSLHPLRLLGLVVPFFAGAPDAPGAPYWSTDPGLSQPYIIEIYWGAAAALLLVLSTRTRVAHRARWLALAAAVTLLFALGEHTPVTAWAFSHVPLLRRFRFPEKLVVLSAVVAPLFAGFGAQRALALVRLARRRTAVPSPFLVAGVVAIAAQGLVPWVGDWVGSERDDAAKACIDATLLWSLHFELAVLAALALLAELSRRRHLSHATLRRFGFCLLVAELGVCAAKLDMTIPAAELTARASLLDVIERDAQAPPYAYRIDGRQRGLTSADLEHVGAPGWDRSRKLFWLRRNALYGASAALHGAFLAQGYSGITPGSMRLLYNSATDRSALDLLSVRYAVTFGTGAEAPYERLGFRWLGQASDGLIEVWKNDFAQPRLRVLDATDKDIAGATATFARYDNDEVVVQVNAPVAATLLLNDPWSPGWAVSVDDAPAVSRKLFKALRAVSVPAGTSTVRWRYSTPGLPVGVAISNVALIIIVLQLVMATSRRQTHQLPTGQHQL